jgi:hypothetical protein
MTVIRLFSTLSLETHLLVSIILGLLNIGLLRPIVMTALILLTAVVNLNESLIFTFLQTTLTLLDTDLILIFMSIVTSIQIGKIR